jgi:arylformamidase
VADPVKRSTSTFFHRHITQIGRRLQLMQHHPTHTMPCRVIMAIFVTLASSSNSLPAQEKVHRDVPYHRPPVERKVLDVYTPAGTPHTATARGPVVFWIHGGGWQRGDKSEMDVKPRFFTERGCVFVATNYRLLPHVDMETLLRDVAEAVGWVHTHAAEYGGDPYGIFLMGHSAGAQVAALLCTDDRYLNAVGVPFSALLGCVPVDGDTYDVPAIIKTGETRRRVHDQPQLPYGHRQKFGDDPQKHIMFSAVSHVRKDKLIPPFLLVHVADSHDTTAQAYRFSTVLEESRVPVTVFAAPETTHMAINRRLGEPDDPATNAVSAFMDTVLAARRPRSREGDGGDKPHGLSP